MVNALTRDGPLSLSLDIWFLIGKLLDISTLNKLTRTSPKLLQKIRPLLFRDLHLHLERKYVHQTVELLCSDKFLAGCVRSLIISSSGRFRPETSSHDRLIEAIGCMDRLQKLCLKNVMFSNGAEEQRLLEQLKRNKVLRTFELSIEPGRTAQNMGEGLHSKVFFLPNLTSLVWSVSSNSRSNRGSLQMPSAVLSILETSMATLETLAFGPPSSLKVHQQLWTMRFPRLRSLKLGEWEKPKLGAKPFTHFLLEHEHTLEELSFATGNNEEFLPFTRSSGLHTNALPHLKVLECNVPTFLHLLQVGLKSLQLNLEELVLRSSGVSDCKSNWKRIHELFKAGKKQKLQALMQLKKFSLDSGGDDDEGSVYSEEGEGSLSFTHIAPFFSCCPKLETLKLDVALQIRKNLLIDALRPLKQLRSLQISLDMWDLDDTRQEMEDDYFHGLVWDLGTSCPRLHEVFVDGEPEDAHWLRIERDMQGAVKLVEREMSDMDLGCWDIESSTEEELAEEEDVSDAWTDVEEY